MFFTGAFVAIVQRPERVLRLTASGVRADLNAENQSSRIGTEAEDGRPAFGALAL